MVGNDIDVIETQSGTLIGNYSVASGIGGLLLPRRVSRTQFFVRGTDGVDKTSWFRVTAFNPNEYIRDRIKKGTLVFVDGDVSMEKYQDEASGKTLSAIRIVQSMFPPNLPPFFSFLEGGKVEDGVDG
jgi:single-stranded DNA-binding protein